MQFQRIILISTLVIILSWVSVLDSASVKIKRVAGDRDLYYKKYKSGRETIRNWEIGVPVLNIDNIGRGYDIIYGNPIETSVGGDKGYRDSVFKVDTSAEATTADWRVVKANHVDISHMISCSMTTSTKEMSSSKEVQNTISKSVENSHEVSGSISGGKGDYSGGLEAGYAHTASEGYNEMSGAVENKDSTIVQMEAECSVYHAKMNPFHWPEFTEQFKKALGTLPTSYNQNTKAAFADFVQAFGTSVVTETLMGSRYGRMYEIKSDAYESFKEKEKLKESETNFSAELSGSKSSGDDEEEGEDDAEDGGEEGGNDDSEDKDDEKKEEEEDEETTEGEAKLGYSHSKSKSQREAEKQQQALSNLASNEMTYAIGARPAETVEEWVQESEADPMPIRIQVTPLTDIVATVDKSKALALGQFYAQYRPVGVVAPKQQLGKCYLSKYSHLIMENAKSPRSLIAKCRPGTTVVGGAFFHLFNEHDDLKVNAHLADIQALKDQLKEYERMRNQHYEIDYLMKNGAKMVKDFAKERGIRELKDILGDRVDPAYITKFLSGKLLDLGIKKKKALHGIANGLKVFGETKLGHLASKMLKNNPYANSIFKVSDSLAKELKDKMKPSNPKGGESVEVLSASAELDSFINTQGTHDVVTLHVDTLAEMMNTLDKQYGPASDNDDDEVQTLIFGKIGAWLQKAHQHITNHINKLFGHVSKHINSALKAWSKFTGKFDDIRKDMANDIRRARDRRQNSDLFQDLMKQVHDDILAIHGKVVLAQRNSLSWMFPYKEHQFVCASGNMGMNPTRRSSFGYCSAYCCSNMAGWKFRTETSRKKTVDHKLKTATTTVKCPNGYSVLSGGVLISDYHPSRFVQVTASTPVGEDSYKCSVKWTETSYVPQVPKYKCYARCAMPTAAGSRLKCTTKETVLVNGHATVHCPSTMMAMGGGWDVKSYGVTFFKKTSYGKVQKNSGSRSFRCELGTSHDVLTGKCVARCCDINPTGVEAEVMKKEKQCRDPTRHFNHLGSKLKFNQEMGVRDIIHSSDKKFFMRFIPNIWRKKVYVQMIEAEKCKRPEHLDSVSFSIRTCISHFLNFRKKQIEEIKKIIKEEKEKAEKERKEQQKKARDDYFKSIWGMGSSKSEAKKESTEPAKVSVAIGSQKQKKKVRFTRPVTWHDFFFGLKLKMTENGFVFVTPFSDEPCARGKEVGNKNVGYMSVSDVGDLNFYNDEKEAVFSYRWSKCRLLYKRVNAKKSVLRSGEMLYLGSGLVSRDKSYTLLFEVGGGLTLYRQVYSPTRCHPPEIMLSTTGHKDRASMANFNQHAKSGWTLRLNEDNNLVMTDEKGKTRWESKTAGKGYGAAQLRIVPGDLELIDSLGQVFWSFHTGSVADCESVREDLKIRSNVYGVGHVFDHTYGGLVSKNKEFVLHIREDNSGGKDKMSLEIWRDGSRNDCSKSRFCVLAENVSKVKLTKDGIQGLGMDGKYRSIFSLKGLDEIKLMNSGVLYAYGGETEHRHSIKKPVKIGTCKFGGVKTSIERK